MTRTLLPVDMQDISEPGVFAECGDYVPFLFNGAEETAGMLLHDMIFNRRAIRVFFHASGKFGCVFY